MSDGKRWIVYYGLRHATNVLLTSRAVQWMLYDECPMGEDGKKGYWGAVFRMLNNGMCMGGARCCMTDYGKSYDT